VRGSDPEDPLYGPTQAPRLARALGRSMRIREAHLRGDDGEVMPSIWCNGTRKVRCLDSRVEPPRLRLPCLCGSVRDAWAWRQQAGGRREGALDPQQFADRVYTSWFLSCHGRRSVAAALAEKPEPEPAPADASAFAAAVARGRRGLDVLLTQMPTRMRAGPFAELPHAMSPADRALAIAEMVPDEADARPS
jgi:hypothetical protein